MYASSNKSMAQSSSVTGFVSSIMMVSYKLKKTAQARAMPNRTAMLQSIRLCMVHPLGRE